MTKKKLEDKASYRSLLGDEEVVNALQKRFASGEQVEGLETLEAEGVSPQQVERTLELGPTEGVPMNALEAIILLTGRPVLLIQDDDFVAPELKEIRDRLEPKRDLLRKALRSVARLDVLSLNSRAHMGTAWMLDEDIMITNRHVANTFARARAGEFVFRSRPSGLPYRADVDFYREYKRDTELVTEIEEVLHIEPDEEGRPDMALLRVSRNGSLPMPLRISNRAPEPDEDVVTIGYPGNAPRSNDPTALEEYFEGIYGVKRLSPGRVSNVEKGRGLINHDCTTLGGNSGSPVIRVETGEVVGLHFAGAPEENNWAASAPLLSQRLGAISKTMIAVPATVAGSPNSSLTAESPKLTAEELADRTGYNTEFLGERVHLPKPIGNLAQQVVPVGDRPDGVLDYIHYSVVMHRNRRLAMLTACNIDGGNAYRIVRGRDSWQTDPRIGDEFQADNRLYSRNPLDRGHLVRRLDPAWGESREEAVAAAEDTFFYTNAAPQHRQLNQQIWLGLEDYVLASADNHDIKVTVFTGPIFRESDREYRGFQIPEDFWKVLAFFDGSTGRLSATAYLLTQSDFLGDLEFVYGAYETYQVPVAEIERQTSLEFHFLRERDPLGAGERLEGAPPTGHLVEVLGDLVL